MTSYQLLQPLRSHLAELYRLRSEPCAIGYLSQLHNCRAKLDRLSESLDSATHYRFELVLMRFERRRLAARFENLCLKCGSYTGTIRRICAACMPKGHNSPQESAATSPNVSRAEPRPRRPVAPATPKPTASQRFLHRFGAGDTLRATTSQPRAMNNPHPQARQHLLVELQGDLFSDSATTTTTTGNAHGTRKNQPAAHAATGPACHPAAPQTASQHTGGGQQ